MAREWTAPVAVVEQFESNDYIAACYTLYCDFTSGGCTYWDSNGNGTIEVFEVNGYQDSEMFTGLTGTQWNLCGQAGRYGCNKSFTVRVEGNNPLVANAKFFSQSAQINVSGSNATKNELIQVKGEPAYVYFYKTSQNSETYHIGLLKNATRDTKNAS